MSIAIICTNKDAQPWVAALQAVDPSIDVQVWPQITDRDAVEFALCWKHPEGVLSEFPNLRCVCSMGAGVDHLLADQFFPEDIPVVRLVDPRLASDMFEYVLAASMYYFRDLDRYQSQQRLGQWELIPKAIPKAVAGKTMAQTKIGIMGLGQIGGYVADGLSKIGFSVLGWSRSEKSLPGITTFVGSKELGEFLRQTEILICMLPLTEWTCGILNLDLFHTLPPDACVINVARGEHLVEDDLLTALDSGHLRGAFLDVFSSEPLPAGHPFWQHDKIRITPHCASITDPQSVAPQIVQNYRNMQEGLPLLHRVDPVRGY